ncbi:MAG TPA: DUF2188 domain-containing protein [Gemmatimonadales bacterium]|nr:DUF2188 domain-containing protein [Gemmatimonadales bacterium]
MTTPHTKITRTVFHVATRDGKWVVTREGYPSGEFDSFETKPEAVERARREAQQQQPSQVKIHRTDGSIETEFTYGGDPYPPRG